ncbi:hypothetical protein V6N11_061843 [Hibiscus sabdariffa]|uniref:Uncharacterized protein n=1 Tax=Hibiscus sabdariffa TaxID=183260 RepID=A0ABR1ZKS1_9ROSI
MHGIERALQLLTNNKALALMLVSGQIFTRTPLRHCRSSKLGFNGCKTIEKCIGAHCPARSRSSVGLENEGGCCWTDSVSPALDIGESSKAVIAIVSDKQVAVDVVAIVGSFEDVVDDVSDRLVGDAEGDLQAVAVEVVVAPKVPSGVEFPSLQDSVQHKRERGRPAKPKKTNIDDRKVLMEKIQGKKVSCLLRQILGH